MRLLFTLLLILSLLPLQAQQLDWLDWEAGFEKMQAEQKLGMVIIQKDGCSLMEHFEEKSMQANSVRHFIDAHFVPVKIIHDPARVEANYGLLGFLQDKNDKPFAMQEVLKDKKLRSPTLFILDEHGAPLQAFSGFIDQGKLALILQYFGEGHHKTTPWKNFSQEH